MLPFLNITTSFQDIDVNLIEWQYKNSGYISVDERTFIPTVLSRVKSSESLHIFLAGGTENICFKNAHETLKKYNEEYLSLRVVQRRAYLSSALNNILQDDPINQLELYSDFLNREGENKNMREIVTALKKCKEK